MNDKETPPLREDECDVLVIGAGPGGSSAATWLVRKGWKVFLLEKEHHPRFHIGESLLPMSLLVFERLGVLDKVKALGEKKLAADFQAEDDSRYQSFEFAKALGDGPGYSYHVCRSEFDEMMFHNAVENGVDGRQGHEVRAVEHRGPREALVDVRPDDGEPYRIKARYVVDASGRDAFLSRKRKLIRPSKVHKSAAVFGRFRGVELREAPDEGNISIYMFPHGWMWMIPQPHGEMSVGAVCQPSWMRQRKGMDRKAFLMQTLESHGPLWSRMKNAELIDDKIYVAGNYTYSSTTIGGPGWLLIGDAFGFLDPVFSSGVHLALTGGERGAELVDTALRHPEREAAMQRELENTLRKGMRRLAWVIYRFNTSAMRHLFRDPRNLLNIESAMISLLAGDVFDNPRMKWRMYLFRMLYTFRSARYPRLWWRDYRTRTGQAQVSD